MKVKFTLEQAMKAQRRSRYIEKVVNAMPQQLYLWERDLVLIMQEAGWMPGSFWTSAENLTDTGIRSPNSAAQSESLR